MGLIPHPPIYLSLIRTHDIWFLLAVGAIYELGCRLYLLSLKMKPASLIRQQAQLATLTAETNAKRKLGPSAFVETAKLERQLLSLEKKVNEQLAARRKSHETAEKILLRSGNMRLSALIWFLYYSVPVLTVDDIEIDGIGEYMAAGTFLKTLFFPISSVGMGVRISKWGLPAGVAANSLGALMVMWSAQTFVGKLFDGVDALFL